MDVPHAARPDSSNAAPNAAPNAARSPRTGIRAVIVLGIGIVAIVAAAIVFAAGGASGAAAAVGRSLMTTTTTTKPVAGSEGRGGAVSKTFPEIYGSDLQYGTAVVVQPGSGRWTVVVVWNGTCACEAMYHVVPEAIREAGANVNLVGIAVDTSLTDAAQTAVAAGQPFRSIVDTPGQVAAALGPVQPGVLVLDDNLRIRGQFGPDVTRAQLGEFLRRKAAGTTAPTSRSGG